MTYLKLRRKWLLLQADKLTKWQLWSFWVKYMSYCAFTQLVSTFNFFSAWDKSHVKWDNSHNSTQKMRTYKTRVCRKNKNCSKETINTLLLFEGKYCKQNAYCFFLRLWGWNSLVSMFLPSVRKNDKLKASKIFTR